MLEERAGASTAANRQYVWGVRYMDDLVLRDRDVAAGGDLGVTGSGLDERFYAMQDPNWNVVAIANVSGTVQERYRYTAYGTPTCLTSSFAPRNPNASAYAWDALYTGRQLDAETGLYQYRNRSYHAELGRFVNRDPIAADVNLYRYVRNRPTGFVDPSGLADCCPKNPPKYWDGIHIKRIEARPTEKVYGHWWVEMGAESYGWWPVPKVSGIWETIRGVPGELNGVTHHRTPDGRGTATIDPHHGDKTDTYAADRLEDGWILNSYMQAGPKKRTRCCKVTSGDVKNCIRGFAKDYGRPNQTGRGLLAPTATVSKKR